MIETSRPAGTVSTSAGIVGAFLAASRTPQPGHALREPQFGAGAGDRVADPGPVQQLLRRPRLRRDAGEHELHRQPAGRRRDERVHARGVGSEDAAGLRVIARSTPRRRSARESASTATAGRAAARPARPARPAAPRWSAARFPSATGGPGRRRSPAPGTGRRCSARRCAGHPTRRGGPARRPATRGWPDGRREWPGRRRPACRGSAGCRSRPYPAARGTRAWPRRSGQRGPATACGAWRGRDDTPVGLAGRAG